MNGVLHTILKNRLPRIYRLLVALKEWLKLRRFVNNYPRTKVFEEEIESSGVEFYSQYGQDRIVFENFFKDKKEGFFCDIGGNHPLSINNTRYFEEKGWRGMAFEPLPHMKALWELHRNAQLFPIALSDTETQLTFVVVEPESGWEHMLSFVKGMTAVDNSLQWREIEVPARRFTDVAREEGVCHIDYLSLDVEGHELQVLQGMDFNDVTINVLTIENNPPQFYKYGDDKLRKFMFNRGYDFWGRIVGSDDIYVRSDFLAAAKK